VPIYEYECSKCGHRFEVIQRISDAPIKKCEKCKGKTEKLISSPAIQFKGAGWFADGYSKKEPGSGPSATKETSEAKDKSGAKDKASKESSGSESKPKPAAAKKDKKAKAAPPSS